mmetsp:Transcript_29546/g.84983  ORF Transcript_29546/g.84983 Transcript_29546/m.84983 type:complete len:806 (+) Transcript_29546:65-2482(+)
MGCEVCKLERGPTTCISSSSVSGASPKSGTGSPDTPHGDILKFLAKVKLFKRLPPDQRPLLAQCCEEVSYKAGQVIISQGEEGHEFFVVRGGRASVAIDNSRVAMLKAGDYFGERALLHNEPRCATIVAETDLVALRIARDDFRSLDLHKRLVFPHRKAVMQNTAGEGRKPPHGARGGGGGKNGGGGKDKFSAPRASKSAAEHQLIMDAIRNNKNLQGSVGFLSEGALRKMSDAAEKRMVPKGEEVITEGSLDADCFFIVQEGSFEVLLASLSNSEGQSADALPVAIPPIGKGGSFGELALLYLAPRAATVVAREASVVWTIDRQDFKEVLAAGYDEEATQTMAHLDRVQVFEPLSKEQKKAVAKALVEMSFTRGENIIEQGEVGDSFYIMTEGEVQVLKDGKEEARLVSTSAHAQIFGERALLNDEPRAATVRVMSPTAKAFAMDRESFNMLLPLEQLRNLGAGGGGAPAVATPNHGAAGNEKIRLADLSTIGLLGCGGFGVVELVEHKQSKRAYAMKSLCKGYIVKSGMQSKVSEEKEIQLMCDSPFIIRLYETFNSPQNLMLLLELAQGGDLYGTYTRKSLHGSEPHAKFYVAGVVCAFEHMHKRRIIYRDLKPENCLLTKSGHLKLADMGLAKVLVGRTFTTCGTPDYFAPEVISSRGYSFGVDWWAVGILVFELLAGHPPFEAPAPLDIFQKVISGIGKVTFPKRFPADADDLVRALCKKEASQRLPMRKGGVKNLREHTWFKSFDWTAFESLKATPPYVPDVSGSKDISNFTPSKDDMPPQIPYKDDGSGWDAAFATSS